MYLAIDEGIIVKKAGVVSLSVREAIVGENLGALKQEMEKSFYAEEEKKSRTEVAKLEFQFVRKFYDLNKKSNE